MTNPITEVTVEECLKELREIWAKELITIECNQHGGEEAFWSIRVFAYRLPVPPLFLGGPLADCMAQVRAWHSEQRKGEG